MKDLQSSRGVSSSGASGSYQPYPKARPSPRNSPQKNGSPRKRLTVGEKLPVLSPEQQTRLQNELLPGCKEPYVQAGLTIAQIHEMSKADGQAQVDQARKYTAVAMSKMYKTQRRAPPAAPAPITAEQRARGRLLRYISLYEDEYREDILEYMYKLQERTMPSRSAMEQQTDIDLAMRRALVDFMVELHSVFHLRQETLYLGINILDRYTSRRVVNKKHYQLVGCVAMWIAAKFEDSKDHVPNTGDLRDFCHNVYEEGSFIQMECHVLNTINWELGHPTSEAWFRCMVNTLDRSGSAAAKEMAIRQGWVGLPELETRGVPVIMADLTTQCIGRYLMEVMVYQDALIDVPPCVIAEAALILSKVINWRTRERTNESPAALHVARYLHDLLSKDVNMISRTLFKKYKTSQFEMASQAVTEFYLAGSSGNCLKFLEELPDVEEVAEQKEAERVAAEEAAAESAAFGEDLEEVDVNSDDNGATHGGLSFADSGYGSSLGDSPLAGRKDAPAAAAGGRSPRSSPSSSSIASPTKTGVLPHGVPPLNLSPKA